VGGRERGWCCKEGERLMNESLGPKAALRQSNVAERHAGRRKARAREGSRRFPEAQVNHHNRCLPPLSKRHHLHFCLTALPDGDISGINPSHSLNCLHSRSQKTAFT
jgi:hypothetical protein